MSGLPLPVTWELDGLVFNGPPDDMGREWVISTEDGWSGSAPPRTSRAPRLWGHGSSRGTPYLDERVIRLDGWVSAPTWAARRDAEHRLAALCAGPQLYPLVCREETGAWLSWVELDDATRVAIAPGGLDLDFSLQVAAPDPLRYWATEDHRDVGLPSPGDGGLTFDPPGLPGAEFTPPAGAGLVFGDIDDTGAIVLDNHGTAPAPVRFELAGPLRAPVMVWHPATGRRLVLDRSLSATDSAAIDTGTRTVTVNGSPNRAALTVADWITAPPGQSRLLWQHGGPPNPTARLTVRWRHTRY